MFDKCCSALSRTNGKLYCAFCRRCILKPSNSQIMKYCSIMQLNSYIWSGERSIFTLSEIHTYKTLHFRGLRLANQSISLLVCMLHRERLAMGRQGMSQPAIKSTHVFCACFEIRCMYEVVTVIGQRVFTLNSCTRKPASSTSIS